MILKRGSLSVRSETAVIRTNRISTYRLMILTAIPLQSNLVNNFFELTIFMSQNRFPLGVDVPSRNTPVSKLCACGSFALWRYGANADTGQFTISLVVAETPCERKGCPRPRQCGHQRYATRRLRLLRSAGLAMSSYLWCA